MSKILNAEADLSVLDSIKEKVSETIKAYGFQFKSSADHLKKIGLTDLEFSYIYLNWKARDIFREIIGAYTVFRHLLVEHFPAHRSNILKYGFDEFKLVVLKTNYLEDITIFDELACSTAYEELRAYCMDYCKLETLEVLTKHKDLKVRIRAYKRLGASYFEQMLKDSCWEIRLMGVCIAPMNHPALSEMIDEKSGNVFEVLIKKINIEMIPYLLDNRNVHKPEIRSVLENRLETEAII